MRAARQRASTLSPSSPALRQRAYSGQFVNITLNTLLPQAYDPFWTVLDDGIFNSAEPDQQPGPPVGPDATFAQVIPVPFTVNTQTAIIASNPNRAFLLIQNNSVAGSSADVLPTLYVAYDGPVSTTLPLGLNLAILPGTGIVLDRRCPGNAVYVKWGTFTNSSGTAFAGGVIQQGLINDGGGVQ